jgi:hypothetical protein
LALRLGVPGYVAPLVAAAVDLSVLGLVAIRELAVRGAPVREVRAARRLLLFASLVTLALNVAEPALAGNPGKAAFDAVGPLLLIGWGEVGPGLLDAMAEPRPAGVKLDPTGAPASAGAAESGSDKPTPPTAVPEEAGLEGDGAASGVTGTLDDGAAMRLGEPRGQIDAEAREQDVGKPRWGRNRVSVRPTDPNRVIRSSHPGPARFGQAVRYSSGVEGTPPRSMAATGSD